jgi:hypothetical protein
MMTKNVTFLPKKLDWFLLSKKEELLKIMIQNGTYIHLPTFGNNTNLVTIFGCDEVYIERTIRCLMLLACEFYVSVVQLVPNSRINFENKLESIQDVIRNTGAEVVIQRNYIEIYGTQNPVKDAYIKLVVLDQLKVLHCIQTYSCSKASRIRNSKSNWH